MAKKLINGNYTKAIVVCHGKSEKLIAEYLKTNLHLNIVICAKDKGEHSIQITSLYNFLKNKVLSEKSDILKKCILNLDKKNKKIMDFNIFTIMDTDDCSEEQREEYKNGNIF